ncbi:hypothetical protein WR25_22528 [Diploscapter pachys]|uniref:FERM domain-containing protein n=1 Tax=Diploscapter pachys TaxID=2018661 RepID=A0A2A2JXX8_9BILA|nr:hypothetical protein WR25_22528 [Diploscapter pachys]
MEKLRNEAAIVQLLDGKFIEISLHARLTVEDVLQVLASHCSLNEADKGFFGLAHVDDRHNYFWLDEETVIANLSFSGEPPGKIHLTHSIRYFVDSIYSLSNAVTIELLFLEIHRQLYKGELLTNGSVYAKAAALLMRVYDSDIANEETALSLLHCILPIPPPKRVFAYFSGSENQMEGEIFSIYCAYRNMPRGDAMLNFLQLISTWPRYGCRHYTVLDTDKNSCLLAVSNRGLSLYENKDSIKPNKVYTWDVLDNLYYKDNEFMIEVRIIGMPKKNNFEQPSLDCSMLSEDDALAQAVLDPTTQ